MHTRFFCTVLLLLAAELLLANDPVNDLYTISKINSIQKGWRAGYNNRFVNLTLTDASKLLGLAEEPVPESPIMRNEEKFVSATNLPDSFDSRARWPNCVMPVRNQEACGGCWSFAASSMFGMKQCIQSSGTLKVEIGPQYPISCDSFNGGCNGGTLSGAWRLYVSNGAISESDYPFDSQNGWTTMCVAKPNVPRYYAGSFTYLRTVSEMQQAIYTGGAIQVGFDVYQDFYNYNSGIYRHVSGAKVGGHSVYLVGWGSENGVDYWLGINSWSEEWGQRGEFKMLRGNNECNVELGYVPIAASIAVNPAYTTTPAPVGTTTRTPTSTTTRAPTTSTTTVKPTYNCWTCPAGQIHWSNVPGTPEPTDKCTCVPNPSVPTTCWTCPSGQAHWYEIPGRTGPVNGDQCACERNPAVPTNCWTCPGDYVHWFEVPGIKTPADRCACVPRPTTTAPTSTTRSPNTIQPTTSTTTTTTRAPTTTTTTTARPTFGCWTCAPGYLHWYEIPGMAQPADRCACVVDPNVRNCWTCPSGFVHWFTIPGMAEPADRCACILKAKRNLNVVHNRLINKIY